MKKGGMSFLLVIGMAFFFSCTMLGNCEAAAPKQITLQLGHEFPDNHPYHLGAVKFAEVLAQKTNNEIVVQIFPNGTLGKQAQLIDALAMGTMDFSLTNTIVLEPLESQVSVLSLPYVMRDWDHLFKVVDGEIGEELNRMLEKKGVTVLAYFKVGEVIINSTKLIKTPDDVSGMKLRVMPGPSMVEVGRVLNAIVTPTAYGEVYTALQLGTIDAQLQSISNAYFGKHQEVAKYMVRSNLSLFLEPLSMSMRTYNRLTPDQRKACKEAAYEAALMQRVMMTQTEQDIIGLLLKEGITITNGDIDQWRARIEPIYAKFPNWLPLIEKVRAVK